MWDECGGLLIVTHASVVVEPSARQNDSPSRVNGGRRTVLVDDRAGDATAVVDKLVNRGSCTICEMVIY